MEPKSSLPHSKYPPSVPILSQLDPVHTPTSHFLKTHFNIILPSTPGSPNLYLSLGFPHQNLIYASPLPHTRYMPPPPISFFSIWSPEQYWVSSADPNYPDTSHFAFLYHKQMKICRPTQRFNFLSQTATCFDSHGPSSGTSFYNGLQTQ